MKKPTVLLADDHKIVLEGLRGLLEEEFHLVGFATNGMELVEQARRLQPEIIVADISMPMLNGIDAVRRLKEEGLQSRVVFLTMHPDVIYASRAMEAGAHAYVLKHSAPEELVTAIREVQRGNKYLSPSLETPAMQDFADETRRHVKPTIELTGRQREVLQLLAEGKSAKEIGGVLGISARTVETHKYKLMDDLGLKSSAQLVQYAIKHGLVQG